VSIRFHCTQTKKGTYIFVGIFIVPMRGRFSVFEMENTSDHRYDKKMLCKWQDTCTFLMHDVYESKAWFAKFKYDKLQFFSRID